jgi:hypothetical protein
MNKQTFSLQPFGASEPPNLKIEGNISRNENLLSISYALVGDIKEVEIAAPSNTPARKHELWEHTCFEFFFGVKNSPQYWEFNLSPAGDWNIYHFDDYRQGMVEETSLTKLPFSVNQLSDGLTLAIDVDLDKLNINKIIPPEQALEIAITSVIKGKDGEVTYWALTHPGAEADFHRRDSFVIELGTY